MHGRVPNVETSPDRRPLLVVLVRFFERIVRGVGVGALATIVDLAALTSLVRAGVPPPLASAPALLLGVVVQFVGSKFVTFENRSRAWFAQGAGFAIVEVAAFALNLVVFDWGIRHVHAPLLVVRVVGSSLVYFGFSLPLWSWVFREKKETS